MIRLILPICAAALLSACQVSRESDAGEQEQAVTGVLADSVAGWNSGNLDRFMAAYSEDPRTSYVTEDGVIHGRKAIAERYSATYDFADPARRGALSIEKLDFRLLGDDNALFVGRYTLIYPDGKSATGPTTIVFEREGGTWRIIADHSS